MSDSLSIELFDGVFSAKAYLDSMNWKVQNGFIRIATDEGLMPFLGNLQNLFEVKIVRVNAVHKVSGKRLHACRVKLEFYGEKQLQTRLYPLHSEIPYRMAAAFLVVRDDAALQDILKYNPAQVFKVHGVPTWDDTKYYLDDSDFEWREIDEQ